MQQRKERVAASIRGALTGILQSRMQDPRLGFVTVTGVDVSPDLRHARVHVSVLGEAAQQEETLQALTGARGFLRSELSHALSLRRMPDLDFRLDHTGELGDRIERLLGDASGPGPDDES